MVRKIILLLIFSSILFACKNDKRISNKLELYKLGVPEHPDTSNPTQIGSDRYFLFDNSDSVLIKYYEAVNPRTGELNTSIPFKSYYSWKHLNEVQKKNLVFSINYLLKLKGHEIPNNKRLEHTGCDIFGQWLAVLTDSTNTKHYYYFISINLPSQLYDLCNLDFFKLKLKKSNDSIVKINTDSIVSYYINNYIKFENLEIGSILPPPINKTNLFNIPPITLDK